ncbi:serine/threonine-protein kinase [Streptomyces sp. NPDC049813]|uniref:serine/threonine-protein kinase n=1 Tax=Streptomyces sp. NPDC049813 TaxID=3365597 RepID=UPI003796B6F9
MGRVWRAVDQMLDRPVAVKEMRIDGLDPEDARTRRERTLREARATARIDHPNVVRVYDVVDEGERLWIVMELVHGRSLEQVLVQDGPLGVEAAAEIGRGLADALRPVHAGGVLHRDIKPGNVMLERAGRRRVMLTDFGIAAIQDMTALTMAGMLVGSPDYMAPERISGRPQGPPSDLWSLGATLCAALGGRSPFSRDTTLATLHAVLHEEPHLPPVAGRLTPLLSALLAKEPGERPDLDAILRALAPPPHEPTLIPHPAPQPLPEPSPPDRSASQSTPDRPASQSTPDRPASPPSPDRSPSPPSPDRSTPPSTPDRSAPPPPPDQSAPPTTHTLDIGRHDPTVLSTEPAPAGGTRRNSPDGPPPGPAGPRPKRRRVALLAVGGALVAGLVAALALTLPGDDTRVGDRQAGGGAAAASRPPTVEGTSRPPPADPSLPPGSRREAGWAWVPPKGWDRVVKTASEVHYTSPDGRQELVAQSALAKDDLLATWQKAELDAHQGQDYRKIRLDRTTFRGRPAVVWEYLFTLEGARWHAELLGFDQGSRSYQLGTWYRPETADRARATYEQVKETFTVLPSTLSGG